MSFESLMGAVQRLIASTEALAALGAELQLRRDGTQADPRTRQLLQDTLRSIDPSQLDGVSPQQEAAVISAIGAAFHYAVDLLENPAKAPGWLHEDRVVLQTIGRMSTRIVHQIGAFATRRPGLQKMLTSPGAFLDIGTGVGWLAIEAAKVWPALKVVGIDIWEPSLQLARANIATAGMEGRVALRAQSIVDFDEKEAFTIVWYPAPFLPLEITPAAMDNVYQALVPGGWLVFGMFSAPPDDPLGGALRALRTVRCGGHPWKEPEVEERLGRLGFEEIETFSPGSLVTMVVGRKPV
jgi:SAM-dependent methyltransferase